MNPMFHQERNRGGTSAGDALKSFFAQKSALNVLLLINVAVWLLVMLVGLVSWLCKAEGGNIVVRYLAVPSALPMLGMKPWTVLSYMFLHEGFWHLFFNMWMLYFGGVVFRQFLSERKLVWTYLLGGVFGALFFVGAYNLFPVFEETKNFAIALGASASVLSILVAAAAYKPDYEVHLFIFGRVRFMWIDIIMVAIDLLTMQQGNAGGHIAHIGGAFWGGVYGLLLRHGFDMLLVFKRQSKLRPTRFRVVKEKKKRKEKNTQTQRPVSDEEYNRRKAETGRDMDAILDKIAKNGYSALTKEEKDFLFSNSGKGQSNG